MNPPLKWAGGKRWLVPTIKHLWKPHSELRLVEPFVGGMAVALGLNPDNALLNDANIHLINFYRQIKKGLKIRHAFRNEPDYFYSARKKFNKLTIQNKSETKEAAALFYYLLKTGFNGLCRFNNSGGFNVPIGKYNTINYLKDFSAYQELFANWELTNLDFQSIEVSNGDFVYADPPYDVEFTKYSVKDFVWDDQIRLAEWLAKHSCPVVMSNQATPRIMELYGDLGFQTLTLPAPRRISCNGDRRKVMEVVAVLNFEKRHFKKVKDGISKNA